MCVRECHGSGDDYDDGCSSGQLKNIEMTALSLSFVCGVVIIIFQILVPVSKFIVSIIPVFMRRTITHRIC